jgi:hypothetical protein
MQDAIVFVQKNMMRYLVPMPYYLDNIIEFHEDGIYRFVEDDAPRYYHDNVVNVIKKANKVSPHNKDIKRKPTFLQSFNMNLKRTMTLEGTLLAGSATDVPLQPSPLMKRQSKEALRKAEKAEKDELSNRSSTDSLPDVIDEPPSPRTVFAGYVDFSFF